MRKPGYRVPPLSKVRIREFTALFRRHLGLDHRSDFPIIEVLEFALPQLIDGYVLEVCSREEMGANHGLTYPNKALIKLREDVYDGAVDGKGRDRFTASHEFGHLMLHGNVSMARSNGPNGHKIYEGSEWQADRFAAELLMPVEALQACGSVDDVAGTCGVSYQAAEIRWNEIKKKA